MRIAIVGTGPTVLYAFKHLIEGGISRAIHLFETGEQAGIGMPRSTEDVSASMLAIFPESKSRRFSGPISVGWMGLQSKLCSLMR